MSKFSMESPSFPLWWRLIEKHLKILRCSVTFWKSGFQNTDCSLTFCNDMSIPERHLSPQNEDKSKKLSVRSVNTMRKVLERWWDIMKSWIPNRLFYDISEVNNITQTTTLFTQKWRLMDRTKIEDPEKAVKKLSEGRLCIMNIWIPGHG